MNPAKQMAKRFQRLPTIIRDETSSLVVGWSSDEEDALSVDSSASDNNDTMIIDDVKTEDKPFAPRRSCSKRDQYQSNWWKRCLAAEETREVLREDREHRDAKEVKGLFGACFCAFEFLVELHYFHQWCNNNRHDACGNKSCSDIESLVLGAFMWSSQSMNTTALGLDSINLLILPRDAVDMFLQNLGASLCQMSLH